MSTMQQDLQKFGELVAELGMLYQYMVSTYGGAVGAAADASLAQQQLAPQTQNLAAGTLVAYLSQAPYKDNIMLKGVTVLHDGSAEPYQLPTTLWPSKPESSTDYAGNMSQPGSRGQRADRVGGLFMYVNDNGTVISGSLEVGPHAGRYKGDLKDCTDGTAQYVCVMYKEEEAVQPALAPLTQPNSMVGHQMQQQAVQPAPMAQPVAQPPIAQPQMVAPVAQPALGQPAMQPALAQPVADPLKVLGGEQVPLNNNQQLSPASWEEPVPAQQPANGMRQLRPLITHQQ